MSEKNLACCRMRAIVTKLNWESIVNGKRRNAVHVWHKGSSFTVLGEKHKGRTYQKSHPGNYDSDFNYLTVQEEAGSCVHHHEQFPCCKHQIRLFSSEITVLKTYPHILLKYCTLPVLYLQSSLSVALPVLCFWELKNLFYYSCSLF